MKSWFYNLVGKIWNSLGEWLQKRKAWDKTP